MSAREAAASYIARGWVPLPLIERDKRPVGEAWPDARPGVSDFGPRANVGVHLGPSGLADVDLDCPEAVRLAPALLPPTPLRFGRDGSPASHWLYAVPDGAPYVKVQIGRETLCELRAGQGKQTVLPPSIHPSGQRVRWEPGVVATDPPAPASGLDVAVRRLGAACLLARAGWSDAAAVEAVRRDTAPADLPGGDEGDKIRAWCGWEATGRSPAPSDPIAKLELKDACAAYVADNPREYGSKNRECPACGGKACFKSGGAAGRWSCWSGHHADCHVGVRSASGDHWSGDVLDLDAHAAGVSVATLLRDRGYLIDRTFTPARTAPERPSEPPSDTRAGLAALAALLAAVEAAPAPAGRIVLVADALTTPGLGLALLHHEAEFNAAMLKIEAAVGKPAAVRKLEMSARAQRAALANPEPDAAELLERGDELEIATRATADFLGEQVVFDLGALHRYDEKAGAWLDYERHHLVSVVSRYAGRPVFASRGEDGLKTHPLKVSNAFANGAAALIESHRRRREFFDRRAAGCGFRNGFLRADGEWLDKRPDHRLLPSEVLPLEYAPIESYGAIDHMAPGWSCFLTDLFIDDEDGADKARCVQEFIGITMLGLATRHERALLLYGPTAGNGKSTLLRVIAALFAPRARCAVPPHLMGERFENVPLATARANLVNDMPDAEIIDSGNLKAIISGDEVQFNPKNRPPFQACPRAGHIFAANNLPHVRDRSRGFWRRMLPIEFRRTFDGTPEHVPDKAARVLEERPQIAAACIRAALDMIEERRGYTVPASALGVLAAWESRANPTREWAEMFAPVSLSSGRGTPGADMYAAYAAWCRDTGHKPIGRNTLFAEFQRMGWARADRDRREWLVEARDGSEAATALVVVRRAARHPYAPE